MRASIFDYIKGALNIFPDTYALQRQTNKIHITLLTQIIRGQNCIIKCQQKGEAD